MSLFPAFAGRRAAPAVFPFTLPNWAGIYEADRSAYQDTALTSPVTATAQNVKGLKDLSGNGNHMVEASANPTSEDISGVRTIKFNNAHKLIRAFGSTLSKTNLTVHALFRGYSPPNNALDYNAFLSFDAGSGSHIALPWTVGEPYFQYPGHVSNCPSPIQEDAKTHLVSFSTDSTAGTSNWWFDAVPMASVGMAAGGTMAPTGFHLGVEYEGPYYLKANLAGLYIAWRTDTQTNVDLMYDYCRTRFAAFYPVIVNGVVMILNSFGSPVYSAIGCGGDLGYTTCKTLTNCGGWWNAAVGGKSTTMMIADYATRIRPLWSRMSGKKIAVLWEATNDMFSAGGNVSAAQAITNYQTLCGLIQGDGAKVIIADVLPRNNDSAFYTKRGTFNATLAGSHAFADDYISFAADSRVGDDGDENDNTYNYGDTVHWKWNTATRDIFAAGLRPKVQALIDA